MIRPFSLIILVLTAMLLFGSIAIDVNAIPTRDKWAVLEELNAYGIDVLDHYPSREPTTADDYHNLGIVYLFRNMPQEAVEQFRKALELNPEHIDSLVGLAASTAQLGDLKTALEYTRKALEIEPNNAKIYNLLGALQMAGASSLDHLDEAETSLKRAISLDSDLVASHMNLARLYVSMKKLDMAVKQYEAVIEIQPESVTAHAELAGAYLIAGLIDKAIEEVGKTIELSPQNPVSHNTLGRMYSYQGQPDKALDEFKKAVELEPTYAAGYKNIGNVHLQKGLPDKAAEEYNKALSYRPDYAEAYSGLGGVYLLRGNIQEAIREYKNAIRVLPVSSLVSVPVYNNLAYIYAEREQNLDEALLFAQKAQQLVPKEPNVADTVGWIYYKKELYEEALANLKIAVEGLPDSAIIKYHLGAVYHKQGAKQEAVAELERALNIDEKFEGAEDAKRLLSELKQR